MIQHSISYFFPLHDVFTALMMMYLQQEHYQAIICSYIHVCQETFVGVNQGTYHVSYCYFFFHPGNDVRVGGEYPLVRVFINVFSSRATGFHREEKLIDLTIFITRAPTTWSNQLEQFLLKLASKFALCLAINGTPALIYMYLRFTVQLCLRITAKCKFRAQ